MSFMVVCCFLFYYFHQFFSFLLFCFLRISFSFFCLYMLQVMMHIKLSKAHEPSQIINEKDFNELNILIFFIVCLKSIALIRLAWFFLKAFTTWDNYINAAFNVMDPPYKGLLSIMNILLKKNEKNFYDGTLIKVKMNTGWLLVVTYNQSKVFMVFYGRSLKIWENLQNAIQASQCLCSSPLLLFSLNNFIF